MKIIVGPPGTGKTTRLLEIVETALTNGVAPNKIAYLAFTKKAANEAKARARGQFDLTEEDLPWFRTLHSLAYRMLGLGPNSVMSNAMLETFADWLGLELSGTQVIEEGVFNPVSLDDKYMFLEQIARVKGMQLNQVYNLADDDNLNWWALERVSRGLEVWKKANGVLDFTDMLVEWSNTIEPPHFELLVIDEAQDLSPVQWTMVHALIGAADDVYIAGDDDQAIFNWAGADVDHFINLKGERTILDHSWRLPSIIWQVADAVSKQISNRIPKTWNPNGELGSVCYVPDVSALHLEDGPWLLLARNKYMLARMVAECRVRGLRFDMWGKDSLDPDHKRFVTLWQAGHKSWNDEERTHIARYTKQYNVSGTQRWQHVIGLPAAEIQYIEGLMANGDFWFTEPPITISTIHGAKGGECKRVAVCLDISKKVKQNFEDNPDDELRVLYVAVSRAQEELYFIEAATQCHYDLVLPKDTI